MSRFVLTLAAVIGLAACSKSADQAIAPNKSDDADKKAKLEVGGTPPTPTTQGGKLHQGSGPGAPNDQPVRGRGLVDLDGDLEITAGNIDKDVVKKVVKENTPKLQYCYEKTLLANPGIEGKVIATFTIAAEGNVSDVKAAGVHPEVETCVADTVRAFKFPPSGKKVDVHYPFNFKPA